MHFPLSFYLCLVFVTLLADLIVLFFRFSVVTSAKKFVKLSFNTGFVSWQAGMYMVQVQISPTSHSKLNIGLTVML